MRFFIVWLVVIEALWASTLSVRDANVTIMVNAELKTLEKDTNLSLNEGDAVCFKEGTGHVVIDGFKLNSEGNSSCMTLAVLEDFNITKLFEESKKLLFALFIDDVENSKNAIGRTPIVSKAEQQKLTIPSDKKEMIIYSEYFRPFPVTLNVKDTKGEVVQTFVVNSRNSFFRVSVDSVEHNYSLVVTNSKSKVLLDVLLVDGNVSK